MRGRMAVIASVVACLMLAFALGCSTDSAPPPPAGPADYTVLGKKQVALGFCVSSWLAGTQVEMCDWSQRMVICFQSAQVGAVLPRSCPHWALFEIDESAE